MNHNGCTRPLDPVDAEALAAGAGAVFVSDAGEHAAQCPSCRLLVAEAAALAKQLDGRCETVAPADLADRVVRLRAFSRLERGRLALWGVPCAVAVSLFCAGCLLLALPGIFPREQVGLAVAACAPLLALSRACAGWLLGVVLSAPAGLEGLSEAFRQQPLPGIAALLLLAPFGMGLKRVLARTRR
ncbi:MAG TPA: hypothetical protein VLO07_07440 [Thermoanaerobaculia bacterium]|nr:hypothetical protein [Thermoanaerobaculia bacterium]